MKALLIDVDFTTGKRPEVILDGKGKIKENLWCGHKWQNIDTGKEIRAVKDGNIDPYLNQDGIVILNNEQEIREALELHFPPNTIYTVSNEGIINANLRSVVINWEELSQTASKEEELEFLYNKGVRGIDKKIMSPQDPTEVFPA